MKFSWRGWATAFRNLRGQQELMTGVWLLRALNASAKSILARVSADGTGVAQLWKVWRPDDLSVEHGYRTNGGGSTSSAATLQCLR